MIKWIKRLFLKKQTQQPVLETSIQENIDNTSLNVKSNTDVDSQVDVIDYSSLHNASTPSKTDNVVDAKKAIINQLSEEQYRAYSLMNDTNQNLFITGKAGTGKSYVLKYFKEHTNKQYIVLAPTGIAAINVGGQTIHSAFGIPPSFADTNDIQSVIKNLEGYKGRRLRLLCSLDTIVIDEISMVRVDLLDMIDAKLKRARKNSLPFGGCQMVFFGDLYQLPPVLKNDDKLIREMIETRYGTKFFFGAPAYKEGHFTKIELEEIHRQNERKFINILNDIRVGNYNQATLNIVNERVLDATADCIVLCPKNETVDRINKDKLQELPGKEFVYIGIKYGNIKDNECPADQYLHLKIGAQIMMLQNSKGVFVNGDMANVVELTDTTIKVRIRRTGSVLNIEKNKWSKYEYQYDEEKHKIVTVETGYFEQYPIRLAYAITIHKSQGQTYDSVCIDYSDGNAFDAGQTYVALSRCATFNGLYLTKPLTVKDITVNQEIINFMEHGIINDPMTTDATNDEIDSNNSTATNEALPTKRRRKRRQRDIYDSENTDKTDIAIEDNDAIIFDPNKTDELPF